MLAAPRSLTVQTARGPMLRVPPPDAPRKGGIQLKPPVPHPTPMMAAPAAPAPAPAPAASAPKAPTPPALGAPTALPGPTARRPATTPAAPPRMPPPTSVPEGPMRRPSPGIAPPSTAPDITPTTVPPSTPTPASSSAPPLPTATGAVTQAFTGNETPYQVLPQQSQSLQSLLAQMQGEASRQLEQPTVYDDPLYQQVTAAQKAGVNENFDAAQNSLNAELAKRGINFSTIAGGKLQDLATSRARALSDVDTSVSAQRAMALASGRQAAMANAQGAAGLEGGVEAQNRAELRGERGYADQLNTEARNEALQEMEIAQGFQNQNDASFQALLNSGLGYGQAPGAAGFLGSALAGTGAAASAYGGQQASADAGLGQLAQLLAQLYAGRGQ